MPSTTILQTGTSSPADEIRQRVARLIEETFEKTPYPGLKNICKPDSDGREITIAWGNKDWRDLQLDMITDYHVDLPLLTPEAFRYYLPALMLVTMFHYQHVGTLPLGVMHSLTPPDPTLLHNYMKSKTDTGKYIGIADFLNRVTAFTPAEKFAIRAFLESYQKWCPKERGEQRMLPRALEFWRTA